MLGLMFTVIIAFWAFVFVGGIAYYNHKDKQMDLQAILDAPYKEYTSPHTVENGLNAPGLMGFGQCISCQMKDQVLVRPDYPFMALMTTNERRALMQNTTKGWCIWCEELRAIREHTSKNGIRRLGFVKVM